VNNPHSLQDLQDNIVRSPSSISKEGFHHESRNIVNWYEASLEAGTQHFCTSSMKQVKLNWWGK